MKVLWKPSQSRIGSRPAIELRTNCRGLETVELGLSGPRGDIWVSSSGRYKAVVVRGLNGQLSSNEQLVRFGESDLERWISKLAIPRTAEEQATFANTFGRGSV
jgi:hypothetical protein